MNGKRGIALAWMMGLFVLLFVPPVRAEDRTQFLIARLQYPPAPGVADDFRIRTSAALGLGSLADVAERDKAITPLCQSLSSDPNDIVRQSVAAALKRLGRPAAASCVRNRLANETNAQVKMQLQRTLDALEPPAGGGGGGSAAPSSGPWTPKFVQNARYYVAVSTITNNTGRPNDEVERAILPSLRSKIESLGGYQLAPAKEGMDAARATISKRKLKGYYLAISVEKFDYAGGNLRVRVKCAVFDYPGKNLRGEVPAGLTQAGVRPGDHSAEQNLMGMAAERAAELFVQNFQ